VGGRRWWCLALVGVVAACGGSGDAGEERASRRAAAATTAAASPGEVSDSTVEVAKTFWFAGSKVESGRRALVVNFTRPSAVAG
jgi:hypothetical protein